MSTDYGALAYWCHAQTCGRENCKHGYCAQFRACDAALRALVADNKRLRERLEVVEREANWDREVAHPDQIDRLRRKVARYVGKAREERRSANEAEDSAILWMCNCQDAEAERDEALGVLRSCAVAIEEWNMVRPDATPLGDRLRIVGNALSQAQAARALLARHGAMRDRGSE